MFVKIDAEDRLNNTHLIINTVNIVTVEDFNDKAIVKFLSGSEIIAGDSKDRLIEKITQSLCVAKEIKNCRDELSYIGRELTD